MRFLLDANMPRAALAVFPRFGHEVVFARDIGLGSASDDDIAAHARSTGSALLTRDLDFADVRRYPPDEYNGIIVLRLPDSTVAGEIALILQRFLNEPAFVDSLPGDLRLSNSSARASGLPYEGTVTGASDSAHYERRERTVEPAE